jgi:hypothetical protein
VTPYDVYQSYMSIAEKKIPLASSLEQSDVDNFSKIKELSKLYTRMALQNVEFSTYSAHRLVFSAIHAACTLLMLDKRYGADSSPTMQNNYFKNFRFQFWQVIA